MRSLFINLPVADTAASKAFYAALGFAHNPDFSDDGTTCIVISEHLYVMAMERARFQGFIEGEIAPAGTVAVLNALSCDSREEVDQLVTKALDAGAARGSRRTTSATCTAAPSRTRTATSGRSCGWTRPRSRAAPPSRRPRPDGRGPQRAAPATDSTR
jgi:predicted lactoylglutathione lyase